MGNSFPQTAEAQRSEKLKLAFQGYIPDGILVRASHVRGEDAPKNVDLARFLAEMVGAVHGKDRMALIGTPDPAKRADLA